MDCQKSQDKSEETELKIKTAKPSKLNHDLAQT